MRSPRVDVVFGFWQCDKENHGWREGPPVTVFCQSFRSTGRAFTLRQSQFRTKKEYTFASLAASASLRTLAGKCGVTGSYIAGTLHVRCASPLPLPPPAGLRHPAGLGSVCAGAF